MNENGPRRMRNLSSKRHRRHGIKWPKYEQMRTLNCAHSTCTYTDVYFGDRIWSVKPNNTFDRIVLVHSGFALNGRTLEKCGLLNLLCARLCSNVANVLALPTLGEANFYAAPYNWRRIERNGLQWLDVCKTMDRIVVDTNLRRKGHIHGHWKTNHAYHCIVGMLEIWFSVYQIRFEIITTDAFCINWPFLRAFCANMNLIPWRIWNKLYANRNVTKQYLGCWWNM